MINKVDNIKVDILTLPYFTLVFTFLNLENADYNV